MRYIFLLSILACFILPTACKKASKPAPAKPVITTPFPVYINDTVNGVPWIADSSVSALISYPTDSGVYDLSFTATKKVNGVGTQLNLYITNYTGVGTYLINPPNVSAYYYINTARHFASSGVINITSVASADTVIGDFNFVADSINVSGGHISIVL